MYKAIIFDMDGVIVDSEEMQQKAYCEAFRKQGVIISPDDYFENTGRKDAFQRIAGKYNRKVDFDSLYNDKNKKYHETIDAGIQPVAGLKNLLELIKGNLLKIGLASASSLMNINFILNKLKIVELFDVIVGIDLVKRGKPYPDIFLLAAERLNVIPKECIVIEDSPNGVKAAKKAGMRCIGFTGTHNKEVNLSEADITVDDLRKISSEILFG